MARISKERVKQELLKCGRSPNYFINNYIKISHPKRGLISMKSFDFQMELVEAFDDHRFIVVLKARQLGISTITQAYICWLLIFRREKNVMVVSTKFNTAAEFVKKIRKMYNNLEPWMKMAKIRVDNRTSFELDNGSKVFASSTNSDAGRGEAVSLLVVDEAAHVPGIDELWTGMYPTLSTGGSCIAISTPNGVGNWFHKNYMEAETKENNFFPVKLSWDQHPERDQEWFDNETKNMSRRQIAQELLCDFLSSGDTVIDGDVIKRIETYEVQDPKRRTAWDRNYWIWEDPKPDFQYVVTADVARGDAKDFSTVQVLNLTTLEQVAEYKGKVKPDMFAKLLYDIGREYNDALLAVEINKLGFSVAERLVEMGYPNMYYAEKGSHDFVEQYIAEQKENVLPGFTTSGTTKMWLIAKMEEYIRNGIFTIRSLRLLYELKHFVYDDSGRANAAKGYNDDLVIAFALACWIRDTAVVQNTRKKQYNQAILSSIRKSRTNINTKINNLSGYDNKTMNLKFEKDKLEKAKRIQKEFLWLYKG